MVSTQLETLIGTEIGVSPWLTIDQERIGLFADATGDHQWIHVEPERAALGPFGSTIAHGFLTLSLLPGLLAEVELPGPIPKLTINYGLDRVRFPAPVRVGSRVRAHMELMSVEEVPGGLQIKRKVTVEVEGQEKPACVAETLTRWVL